MGTADRILKVTVRDAPYRPDHVAIGVATPDGKCLSSYVAPNALTDRILRTIRQHFPNHIIKIEFE